MGTTFPVGIDSPANSAYFPHRNALKFPITIDHRGLTAKVYGKTASYAFYRAVWQDGGKQKQKACKKLADAKLAASTAIRQIAKGKTNLPTDREINELRIAQTALQGTDMGQKQ